MEAAARRLRTVRNIDKGWLAQLQDVDAPRRRG